MIDPSSKILHLLSQPNASEEEDLCLEKIHDLLAQGACVNTYQREVGRWVSPLTLAAHKGMGEVVALLLDHGAEIQWPEEKVPLRKLHREEGGRKSYMGVALDPLGNCFSMLAACIEEVERKQARTWEAQHEAWWDRYWNTLDLLLRAGATHRPDPAFLQTPLDMALECFEVGTYETWTEESRNRWAVLLCHLARFEPDPAQALENLAHGRFGALKWGRKKWWLDFPESVGAVQRHAQEALLQHDTAPSMGSKNAIRL